MQPPPGIVSPLAPPPPNELFTRYGELKQYVGLTDLDIQLAIGAWPLVEPLIPELVDDFYEEILRHEAARRVFQDFKQVERLKATLGKWIAELFRGTYDERFVARRWQVGFRHVQIGLEQVWVSAAMTRLRERLALSLRKSWTSDIESYVETVSAIRRMMDLDLALIQDAYHCESVAKQIAHERDFAEGVIETAQAVVMVVTLCGRIVRGNAFLSQLVAEQQLPPSDVDCATDDKSVIGSPERSPVESDNTSLGNIFHLITETERPSLAQFLAQAASERNVKPLETEILQAKGSPRRIRWHARRLQSGNSSDSTPIVLCVGQDITDLTEAQRLLVRQERLAAIGQTMTGLAHESRNAFQRSQASLETLLLELEDRPSAVELIERIQRAHDHLLHLYEEVLQFARPVLLDLQPTDLINLMKQTWQHVMQGGSARGTKLLVKNLLQHHEITADPFALEQVFRNLLENATQASEGDAHIEVHFDDTWIVSVAAVRIIIRDHGRGLPAEYLERIFEPFFTTRPRGTGLGLPIARRLVESHGGSLVIRPAEGGGTQAEIILPRTAIPDAQLPPPTEDTRRGQFE